MLNLISDRVQPKCDGSSRREFLQVGTLALGGLTLPDLLRARAAASEAGRPTSNKSVILLFLDGGAPQHETFDAKPDAPAEYRSIFGVTRTRLPGVLFGSPAAGHSVFRIGDGLYALGIEECPRAVAFDFGAGGDCIFVYVPRAGVVNEERTAVRGRKRNP